MFGITNNFIKQTYCYMYSNIISHTENRALSTFLHQNPDLEFVCYHRHYLLIFPLGCSWWDCIRLWRLQNTPHYRTSAYYVNNVTNKFSIFPFITFCLYFNFLVQGAWNYSITRWLIISLIYIILICHVGTLSAPISPRETWGLANQLK